ncbi:MAG: hypothetical protein IKJ17_05015 [Clostridia bacterium]|nr:hypothetical protein [Clostridia bacterium]
MKKRVFYTELAYVFGVIILAIGTAFMTIADFGLSMVVAPAYLLHLKVSQYLPFFTFGMAEYVFQAVLLIVMMILLRKVKLTYLFSFVTTVIYGVILDASIALLSFIPADTFAVRGILYVVGMPLSSLGVALLFRTYIPPAAYELFVKEVSAKFKLNIHKFKSVYDYTSCIISIVLSFAFFGMWHFEGIKAGTLVCALLNGVLISVFTKIFDKIWFFEDYLKNRRVKL